MPEHDELVRLAEAWVQAAEANQRANVSSAEYAKNEARKAFLTYASTLSLRPPAGSDLRAALDGLAEFLNYYEETTGTKKRLPDHFEIRVPIKYLRELVALLEEA
jgi:hypothetical protein